MIRAEAHKRRLREQRHTFILRNVLSRGEIISRQQIGKTGIKTRDKPAGKIERAFMRPLLAEFCIRSTAVSK